MTTRLIVGYVRAHAGEEGVRRLLARAGETRDLSEIENERTWSTYDQKVALLDAAGTVLGDLAIAVHVGESVLEQRVGLPVKLLLRALGSPAQVVRNIARAAPKFTTVADMTALDISRNEAVVSYRLHDGFPPSRYDCDLNIGLMSQISVLFGLPPATIEHPKCQVKGATTCIYRVRWARRTRLPWRAKAARIAVLEDQVQSLSERTEALQSTIADLVSPDDVETVLARVAARAGEAVRAQAYLLVVQPFEDEPPQFHNDGLSPADAERLAQELLTGSAETGDSRLVVEVASARRRYGHLAALYPQFGSFFPEEQRLLAAYGRHAAVALDAATALEEARTRGGTATALLELSGMLAEALTRDEVAQRLAEATPAVAGSSRAVVMLWDPEAGVLRARGSYGAPPDVERLLRATDFTPENTPELGELLRNMTARRYRREDPGEMQNLLERFGSSGAFAVPIAARGDLFGVVAASNGPDEEPLRVTATLAGRMAGLADQAAGALQRAMLLEREQERARILHIRAHHDGLTGLPNRLLFNDRLGQALAQAARTGAATGLIFIDLDHFKAVNDRLGHPAGDLLLQAVADRLRECLREEDTVARVGGDEFTILLPRIQGRHAAALVVEKVMNGLRAPFAVNGNSVAITASLGIALAPEDGGDMAGLWHNADFAMYRAKDHGRDGFRFYGDPVGLPAAGRAARG